jgi:hypothetical protein
LGWKQNALCRFDPGTHWDTILLPSMFDMCMSCPVKMDCLDEALVRNRNGDIGIWGGTTVTQREAIRRGRITPQDAWDANRTMQETFNLP